MGGLQDEQPDGQLDDCVMPVRLEAAIREACHGFIDQFGLSKASQLLAVEAMFSTYYQVFVAGYQVGWHEHTSANIN